MSPTQHQMSLPIMVLGSNMRYLFLETNTSPLGRNS